MVFFKDEFEAKVCVANLLDKLTFKQAEAVAEALSKWDEYDKLKSELEITRQYIHDNGLEWDLLSYSNRHIAERTVKNATSICKNNNRNHGKP